MPYVNVPKDITKITSKAMFGLTKRQLIAFSIAAALGFPVFLLCFLFFKVGIDISSVAMIIVMLPIILFAFYERYGQEGLLFFGNVIIPFRDPFPTDTQMYKLMTTKPKEVYVNETA